MKNFDDPDAFDEALAITKRAVEIQAEDRAIDTVFQENRALEAEVERLRVALRGIATFLPCTKTVCGDSKNKWCPCSIVYHALEGGGEDE